MKPMFSRLSAGLAALLLASCATLGPDQRAMTELDGRLKALATVEYGADRAPLVALSSFLTDHRSPADRKVIEPRLAAFAQSAANSRASRQHVIRELGRVGSGASVPVLAAILGDPELGDDAAMALERMADPKADAAVLAALASCPDAARGRIVAVLGQRRVAGAVPAIAPFLRGTDTRLAATTAAALGNLASPAAASELMAALPQLKDDARTAAWDALLTCQAAAIARGDSRASGAMVLSMDKAKAPAHVRAAATLAALRGASPRDSALQAAGLLSSVDPALQSAGAALARRQTDDRSLLAVIATLPSLPPVSQIAVLGLIEDRRLAVASPIVVRIAASSEPATRKAALRTLGPAGRADSVATLLAAASEGEEDVRAVARKSLRLVSGPGVDETILGAARSGTPAVRAEIIRCLGDRGLTAGLPLLFTAAADADAALRTEAIRQIGTLAGEKEWSALLNLLATCAETDRATTVTAAETAALRLKAPGVEVAARLATTPAPAIRTALLSLAGKLSSDATLPEVKKAIADADPAVRSAALRALGTWTHASALATLLEAAGGSDPQVKRLAQRGAIQVTRKASDLDAAARIAGYKSLAGQLGHIDEQRMLLSALGELGGAESAAIAAGFLDKPDVRAEAEAAVLQIAKRAGKPDATVAAILKRIAAESSSPSRKDDANALLK